MVKYKLQDGSIIDVTNYSQDEIDFLLMQNPEAELVEEEKVGKTSDVAAKGATVTSSPGQASENTELKQVDTSLVSEDPEPVVSASKQRIAARKKRDIARKEKQKQEEEQSFFDYIFSDEPVYDKTQSFRNKRNKIDQIAKDRAELERKATVYSYNNMPGLQSVAYVENQLKEFDKAAAKELEILNLDPEFKLRNDAIEQLSKDTGSTQATGDGLEDTLSEFNVLNVFRGKSYFKDIEASEIIDINAEVEDAVVSKLDNKQLQKLSKGFYTLQEKENLLNEVKIPIVKNKIKEIQDDGEAELVKTEDKISDYKKAQEAIIKSLNILKSNPNITQEDVNEYNLLVNNYKDIDIQIENTVNNFKSYKTKSLSKIDSLEGDFGIDLATGVINNNFKLTDKVEKFREKYSGDGWWNGTADIVGGELMQGAYQLLKKTYVGAPTWLLTSFGDAFQDQDNYSDFDAFSDVINNWSNKTLLPKSQAEKFKITKEEGGLKEFSARNYAKLGVSMIPFTAQLINEVKKGKFTGLRSAIGKNYLKLSDKSKVLKDASQKLKDNIIMADAAFRATIMDNQKEGEALGLSGLQASTFAAAKSATEASVQLIMPDTQFLKGVTGKAIKDAFVGNLKKVANIQGAKAAVKEFSTNILKEYGEEEVNAAMNLVTDASYGIALPKASEFLNSQIELTAGTFMLSGGMGTVGSSKTFSNQKKLIYNQIHDNIASLDLGLKTMQETSKNSENIDQIIKAREFARDISKAIESSPENVTADQIDLLLEKQQLIKKKQTTDSAFHQDINSKIEEVDAKIQESSVKKDIEEQFDKDILNVGKSLKSIGQEIDETIVFEDNEKGSASDQMKEFLISTGKSEKYAEENKDSYGAFTVKDGREILVVNKTSALSDSFVTTGQHEFLHKLLNASLSSNPDLITKAGELLLKEIKSTVSADSELASRIEAYARDTEITDEKFYEEILPLFSEALTRKDVKLNSSSLKKISDFFRRVFQNMGLKKIKFDTDVGVINFIKDYNKAYSKGKFKGALKTLSEGDIKKSVEISLSKNKELGNEIKALVPEGTTKRKYDSRVIGDVYAKLVQGNTLDGLINGQLNKFGVVGDNVYGKPKDVFLEDVKAQLYEKSLTRFNPETNDDLGGFVVNELIRYRIGDVVNRYKKEAGVSGKSLDVAAGEAGSVQEVADDAVSIEEQIDVADTVSKEDSKLTKATKILSKEQYNEASEIIKEKIKDIDPKNLSYKKVGGFITDILSYITSVPADKILDSTKNLSQGQVTTAAMFIEKNIDYIRRTLPEGAVLGAATEKLMGTSTGVPSSVLKRLYDKNPRIKKGAGLSPWTLKKGLTNNDILEAIGRPKGVEPKRISPRSPEGQVIKGILNIVDKNITNELVRTVESDLTLEQKQDVAAGKSSLMFSKSINDLDVKQKKIVKNSIKDLKQKVKNFYVKDKDKKNIIEISLNEYEDRLIENLSNEENSIESSIKDALKVFEDIITKKQYSTLVNSVDIQIKSFKDKEFSNKSFERILRKIVGTIDKLLSYQIGAIGFESSIDTLKNRMSNSADARSVLINYIRNESRSIRSFRYIGLSTNQALYEYLKDKGINIEEYGLKMVTEKTGLLKGKKTIQDSDGNRITGYISVENLKQNFKELENNIDEEAEEAKGYINGLLSYYKNKESKAKTEKDKIKIKEDAFAHLKLLSIDQRGAIRKISRSGLVVMDKNGKYMPNKETVLEHAITVKDLIAELKKYINNEIDLETINSFIDKAKVNIIPKKLDEVLTRKGFKSTGGLKRMNAINRQISTLNKKGRVYGYDKVYGETSLSKNLKERKAKELDKTFNDILEEKSGIPSMKRYGIVEAITKGSSKGKFNFFIPPSAEDFVGLLYPTLGKGKVGDAQMSWYKKNLINPYAEGMNKISKARVYMMNTYNSLKKQLDVVPKDLAKKIEGTDYTREQALRVYIWNKQKMNIPGISDADVSKLTSYIADNANLQLFGDQLINMQMGDGYVKPKEGWPAGTITTDILEGLNTTKRAKYLKDWQDNVDAIFSEENLNKLQAIYGLNYRKALENMLSRMKSGRNRSFSGDSLTGRFTDWLTGSVGTIMFLNTRSAVLQTISAINFVNFTDNNVLAAGKAFANQKQYWADFMTLMNSDFLKERRGGLRINVNEADIADMAKKGGVKGAISKLLELGFAPTQIADSFAIASGGSAFYRNRINTYLKEKDANGDNVYTKKQAEKKAFEDFRETAEESQQSSRPDRISQQQASPLGRVVLAFANTPAQYARIIKKAASDLKNGRGDAKENISKIIYYGVAQNLIFNALQQALFAFGFGEDEPEEEEKQKKYVNIANGMLDSLLRGGGIGGSIVSVGKNAIIKIIKELEKDRPKLQNIVLEISKISPPVSAKLSRLQQAARSYDWNKQEMKEKGLSLDNPAFLAGANVVSALTNIPLDRAIKKANNVVSAISQDLETWERISLLGGWAKWELGIKEEKKKKKKKGKLKSKKFKSKKIDF